MPKSIAVLLFVAIAALLADAQAVTISWAPVGSPGNAPDATMMDDRTSGYCGVGYSIGIYDVTNSQYVVFLNAKDPTGANPHGLWITFDVQLQRADCAEIGRSAKDSFDALSSPGNLGRFPICQIAFPLFERGRS
jgi:hypothetical protein